MKFSYTLKPLTTPLVGWFGLPLILDFGMILPLTIGKCTNIKIMLVEFLFMDYSSSYNGIMEGTFLHETRVVASTYHIALKFPIDVGT